MYITIIQNQNSQFSISKHKLSITRREKKNRSSQFTESQLFHNLDKNYSLHINIHSHIHTHMYTYIIIIQNQNSQFSISKHKYYPLRREWKEKPIFVTEILSPRLFPTKLPTRANDSSVKREREREGRNRWKGWGGDKAAGRMSDERVALGAALWRERERERERAGVWDVRAKETAKYKIAGDGCTRLDYML